MCVFREDRRLKCPSTARSLISAIKTDLKSLCLYLTVTPTIQFKGHLESTLTSPLLVVQSPPSSVNNNNGSF